VEHIVIRDARPADVAAVSDVFRHSSLSNEGDRANLLAHPDTLEWAADPVGDGRTRVAVVEHRVVGFATTSPATDGLELDDLFVDPDWMRHGVGRALVDDVVATARRRNCRRITVTANEHALAFYERVGFVTHGFAETMFGPARRMTMELRPSRLGAVDDE
jgi:GNAT superfamily N-acetyltransferase